MADTGRVASDQALVSDGAAERLHPSRVTIHLRNKRAERHPHTKGDGKTWCGKNLLGEPENERDGIETFTSYGNRLSVTLDPDRGSCDRCCEAFETAYSAAFPEGLKLLATFRLDDPADMQRARTFLSPEGLSRFFGPGGGGLPTFDAALRDSDGSPKGGDASDSVHDSAAIAQADAP